VKDLKAAAGDKQATPTSRIGQGASAEEYAREVQNLPDKPVQRDLKKEEQPLSEIIK
jgi:hypothetical protein